MSRSVNVIARSENLTSNPFQSLLKLSRALLAPLFLAQLLTACAIEGDFGRPRATIFDRVATEFLASDATLLGTRGGSGVTDEEAAMREAGHRLATPLNPTPPASSIPPRTRYGGYGGWKDADRHEGAVAFLASELDADHQALTNFGQAARRVLITDSRRMQAVHENDPYVLVEDKTSARERMRENLAFIESVFTDFGYRLQAYHYAIAEGSANEPEAVVVDLDSSLRHLRDRTASLEYELTHYFGSAVARGDYRPPRFASRTTPAPSYEPPISRQPEPYGLRRTAPYGSGSKDYK